MAKTLVWVIYDISDDRIRNRVAKLCKAIGLERVQKSAFLGKLPTNRIDELSLQCEELIDTETDSVYLFPLCPEDFRRVKTLGLAFDPRYVNDEIISSFF
jgi:CRISPR-associated protein Cas2